MFVKNCQTFRNLLSSDCLMVPGCFNGMSGRLATENGFKAVYISGAAVTAS